MTEYLHTKQSVNLNYYEGPKNGSPVLLLHGNMGRWQAYSSIIDALSTTKHVFAVDLRGHGKSSHIPDSYVLKTRFADIVSLLKEKINEPVTLVGYSLGGMIALMIAAQHPELIQRLIVIEPPLTLQTITPIIESQKEFAHKILHYLRTNQMQQLHAEINDESSSLAISLIDPSVIEITIDKHENMIEGFDIAQIIPLIDCPCLLLRGETHLGSMISDEDIIRVKQLSSQITDIQFAELGHSMLSEDRVVSALLDFIK